MIKYMILKDGQYAEGKFVPEGATVIDSPRLSHAHAWENNKWVFKGFSTEEALFKLRMLRNAKLIETDWWTNSDVITTNEQKAYRQELRDLPATASPELNEDGNLTGVTWPEKPE
jgi:hypothetical protein